MLTFDDSHHEISPDLATVTVGLPSLAYALLFSFFAIDTLHSYSLKAPCKTILSQKKPKKNIRNKLNLYLKQLCFEHH